MKRSSKPAIQYSPSSSPITAKHHLIIYDDNETMMIVGNSSIKRIANDGTVVLNNGRRAKLIISGTKDKCIKHWNKKSHLSINNNHEQIQDDDDESPDIMQQTLQTPSVAFSTPAPYRREKTLVRRSSSSDFIFSTTSPKRRNYDNQPNPSTIKRHNAFSSSTENSNRSINDKITSVAMSSSDDDEENNDIENTTSMGRLFEELKYARENIKEARTESLGIQQQLSNLTKKISNFRSLILSNHDHDLDRYRDPNVNEEFKSEIMYENSKLLEVPAKDAAEYARNLLKILFSSQELQTSLLPSHQSKRYLKPELNHEKFELLNDAVRTGYRIGKHYYKIFYKERIQYSLAACLYNEGIRKPKKHVLQQQHPQVQVQAQTNAVQDPPNPEE